MKNLKEIQLIVKAENGINDFLLDLKNNLDNQIIEANDKKFWGTISGNQIEVKRKPRFYKNYKSIKFYGTVEDLTNDELKINGSFKEYRGANYLAVIVLILLFNLSEIFILKIALNSHFYMVNLLFSIGFILLCNLINFNLINEDKHEILEFLSNK